MMTGNPNSSDDKSNSLRELPVYVRHPGDARVKVESDRKSKTSDSRGEFRRIPLNFGIIEIIIPL